MYSLTTDSLTFTSMISDENKGKQTNWKEHYIHWLNIEVSFQQHFVELTNS